MKNYHLVPMGDLWKLTVGETEKPVGEWSSRAEAVAKATRIVEGNGGSLKIHLADGTIGEERTYPRVADAAKSAG